MHGPRASPGAPARSSRGVASLDISNDPSQDPGDMLPYDDQDTPYSQVQDAVHLPYDVQDTPYSQVQDAVHLPYEAELVEEVLRRPSGLKSPKPRKPRRTSFTKARSPHPREDTLDTVHSPPGKSRAAKEDSLARAHSPAARSRSPHPREETLDIVHLPPGKSRAAKEDSLARAHSPSTRSSRMPKGDTLDTVPSPSARPLALNEESLDRTNSLPDGGRRPGHKEKESGFHTRRRNPPSELQASSNLASLDATSGDVVDELLEFYESSITAVRKGGRDTLGRDSVAGGSVQDDDNVLELYDSLYGCSPRGPKLQQKKAPQASPRSTEGGLEEQEGQCSFGKTERVTMRGCREKAPGRPVDRTSSAPVGGDGTASSAGAKERPSTRGPSKSGVKQKGKGGQRRGDSPSPMDAGYKRDVDMQEGTVQGPRLLYGGECCMIASDPHHQGSSVGEEDLYSDHEFEGTAHIIHGTGHVIHGKEHIIHSTETCESGEGGAVSGPEEGRLPQASRMHDHSSQEESRLPQASRMHAHSSQEDLLKFAIFNRTRKRGGEHSS